MFQTIAFGGLNVQQPQLDFIDPTTHFQVAVLFPCSFNW